MNLDFEFDLLKKYYDHSLLINSNGYQVAFSGGKDSIVIYDILKKSGLQCSFFFNNTGLEIPEIPIFIKHNYIDVEILKPKINFWELCLKKKMLPTRKIRFCCDFLKERSDRNGFIITGVRGSESFRRSKRSNIEIGCVPKFNVMYLHLIHHWSSKNVWDYIKENNLPYPKAYDKGWKRIGCIGCPMSSHILRELNEFPNIKKAYFNTVQKIFSIDGYSNKYFDNAESYFKWWCSGFPINKFKAIESQYNFDFS